MDFLKNLLKGLLGQAGEQNTNRPIVISEIRGISGLGVHVICENGNMLSLNPQESTDIEESARTKCGRASEGFPVEVSLSNLEGLRIVSADGTTAFITGTCKNKEDIIMTLTPGEDVPPFHTPDMQRNITRKLALSADEVCAPQWPGSIPDKKQNNSRSF